MCWQINGESLAEVSQCRGLEEGREKLNGVGGGEAEGNTEGVSGTEGREMGGLGLGRGQV